MTRVCLAVILVAGCKGGSATGDAGAGGGRAGATSTADAGGAPGTPEASGAAGGSGAGGTSGVGASSGASGGAGAGGASGGGGQTATGCAKSLAGTWDIIVSRVGAQVGVGLLVLTPDTFSIKVTNPEAPLDVFRPPHGELDYTATGMKQAVWSQGGSEDHVFAITNTPMAVDAGSIPLALGGAWTFTGKAGTCSAQVGVGALTGSCTSSGQDFYVGGGDWPARVPLLVNGRTYTATRTSVLPSNFGDFGGTWETKAVGGMSGACQVTVSGNQFTSHCTVPGINGQTVITISDDCIASGMNPGGDEISGQRR
jgi:hypothetical protein